MVSTTIKAYPTIKVIGQPLAIIPLTNSGDATNALFDAISLIYSEFPRLSDEGYSGYGPWTVHVCQPIAGNSTSGYVHEIAIFGASVNAAEDVFAPTAAILKHCNGTSLHVTGTYTSFVTYSDYYKQQSGAQGPAGSNFAIGSRFLDREALVSQPAKSKQNIADASRHGRARHPH